MFLDAITSQELSLGIILLLIALELLNLGSGVG